MLSRRILTVLLLATCIFAILIFVQGMEQFSIPLAICILLIVPVYIFQHQLNWWFYQKFPPTLPASMHKMFLMTSQFYQSLKREQQDVFGRSVRMFVEAKEFIEKGMDDFPEDVKYIVGYYAVRSIWPDTNELFENYGRIVVYPHPFLTPNDPEIVHTVEVEHEDGTLIFSMEHLLASYFRREKFYQIGFHAFADVLLRSRLQDFPEPPGDLWERLNQHWHISQQVVSDFIGLPVKDNRIVMLSVYLRHPRKAEHVFPELIGIREHIIPTNSSAGN